MKDKEVDGRSWRGFAEGKPAFCDEELWGAVHVVELDIIKAFDMVSHRGLTPKLLRYGQDN